MTAIATCRQICERLWAVGYEHQISGVGHPDFDVALKLDAVFVECSIVEISIRFEHKENTTFPSILKYHEVIIEIL